MQGRDELGAHRDHAQPVGPDAHVRRFVGRHGGRGGRRSRPAEHRDRRRRVGAHPRRVLRQRRPQAELRAGAAVPDVAVRHRVAPRAAHDERGRRRAHDERAQAARRPGLDGAAARRPRLPDGLDDGVVGLRIAYSPTLGYADVHPEVAAAVGAAAAELAAAGAIVEAVDPGFDDPLEITTGLWFTGSWVLWNTLGDGAAGRHRPRLRRPGRARLTAEQPRRAAAQRPPRRARLADAPVHGALRRAADADGRRPGVRGPTGRAHADVAGVDARVDAVLLPVQPDPAAGLHDPVRPDRSTGLPIGLQFVGPMFGDPLVLRAARAWEQLHPVPRPPI